MRSPTAGEVSFRFSPDGPPESTDEDRRRRPATCRRGEAVPGLRSPAGREPRDGCVGDVLPSGVDTVPPGRSGAHAPYVRPAVAGNAPGRVARAPRQPAVGTVPGQRPRGCPASDGALLPARRSRSTGSASTRVMRPSSRSSGGGSTASTSTATSCDESSLIAALSAPVRVHLRRRARAGPPCRRAARARDAPLGPVGGRGPPTSLTRCSRRNERHWYAPTLRCSPPCTVDEKPPPPPHCHRRRRPDGVARTRRGGRQDGVALPPRRLAGPVHAGALDDRLLTLAQGRASRPSSARPAPGDRLLLRLSDRERPDDDDRKPPDRSGGALDRALPGGALLAVLQACMRRCTGSSRSGGLGKTNINVRQRRSPERRPRRVRDLPAPVQPRPRLRPDRPFPGLVRAATADRQGRRRQAARCASGWSRRSCSAATCWSSAAGGSAATSSISPRAASAAQLGCVIAFSTFDQAAAGEQPVRTHDHHGRSGPLHESGGAHRRRCGRARPDRPEPAVRPRLDAVGRDQAARTDAADAEDRVERASRRPTAGAARPRVARASCRSPRFTAHRSRSRVPTRPGGCICLTRTSRSATWSRSSSRETRRSPRQHAPLARPLGARGPWNQSSRLRRLTAAPTFDLQSHSLHSDGALSPSEVVASAAAAGVELLSLTDHDTVDGVSEAARGRARLGIRLVTGVEISAIDVDGRDLHILGYVIDERDRELRAAPRVFPWRPRAAGRTGWPRRSASSDSSSTRTSLTRRAETGQVDRPPPPRRGGRQPSGETRSGSASEDARGPIGVPRGLSDRGAPRVSARGVAVGRRGDRDDPRGRRGRRLGAPVLGCRRRRSRCWTRSTASAPPGSTVSSASSITHTREQADAARPTAARSSGC